MFASENTMLAQDALNKIQSITEQLPFTYGNEKTSSYDIEFKNVCFHYPNSEEEVLKMSVLKSKKINLWLLLEKVVEENQPVPN